MQTTHVTASRLKCNRNCEFKFFLEYHIMYPPLKEGNIYAEKGSAIHEALEKWVNSKLGQKENANEDYEETLREYYERTRLWRLDDRRMDKGHPHPVEKTCESCPWASKDNMCLIANQPIDAVDGCPRPNFQEDLNLTKNTIEREDVDYLETDVSGVLNKKILGVEQEFDTELGGVRVRGVMDLVLEEDEDTIEVCDYKSGRSMSYNSAFKDEQVRIYGAIARKLWPQYKYVMVTLYYLKNKPVSVPLSKKDDELTIKSLQKRYKEIIENHSPRRNKSWLCNFCVGWEECGEIYDKFRGVDGKFRLPIISCDYSSVDGPCWGSIYPVENQVINKENIRETIYACKGHRELYNGGNYIPEESDSDKVS